MLKKETSKKLQHLISSNWLSNGKRKRKLRNEQHMRLKEKHHLRKLRNKEENLLRLRLMEQNFHRNK